MLSLDLEVLAINLEALLGFTWFGPRVVAKLRAYAAQARELERRLGAPRAPIAEDGTVTDFDRARRRKLLAGLAKPERHQ